MKTPTPAAAATPWRMSRRTEDLLAEALAEDVGSGDATTERTTPKRLAGEGRIIAKAGGVFCGAPVAEKIWRLASPAIRIRWNVAEGERVSPGDLVAELSGPFRGLLMGERVALNFLQRLSGISTLTRLMVDLAEEGARAAGLDRAPDVLDTRKTTPLWRELERHAVRMGGGVNHRFGLFDMILIKENHVRAAGGVGEAIRRARKPGKGLGGGGDDLKIGAEVRDEAELIEALAERPDLILLDNMTPARARALIRKHRAPGVAFEISGGIGPANVAAYAAAGADRLSAGGLTHSAPALDLSLQIHGGTAGEERT